MRSPPSSAIFHISRCSCENLELIANAFINYFINNNLLNSTLTRLREPYSALLRQNKRHTYPYADRFVFILGNTLTEFNFATLIGDCRGGHPVPRPMNSFMTAVYMELAHPYIRVVFLHSFCNDKRLQR